MPSASSRRIAAIAALVTVGGLVVAMPTAAMADPATVTQAYGYTGATDTFTVPDGITQLTLQLAGGEGGRGGDDVAGPSPAGGYQGVVSGTVGVTPGQVLTIAVGQGGATGMSQDTGQQDPGNFTFGAAPGGANPLGYNGGDGGVAGWQGDSGDAGGGGGATVVTIGAETIVAGGAGGAGGSGQFAPTIGRLPYSTFTGRSDAVSVEGQDGITVGQVCDANTGSCDGGGGGAGGGGVVGGAQGDVQFGSGTSDEWYGYGGYPGQNSTGGLGGLAASYQYYPDDSADGSLVISYTTGAPGAPTDVSGVAGNTSVALSWTPPAAVGESVISDYVVEYALASDPTNWTTFADGVSTATTATVTGLTDGTAYIFEVSAVNTAGSGTASAASSSLIPMGVPGNPTITSITAQDGALSLAFTAPTSGAAPTAYEYQLNGAGSWISAGTTTSPLVIPGLTNGTLYSVQIRANSAVGEGSASPAGSGTPEALPGAPSISSTSTGIGSAVISFTPGYAGGGSITDYEYELNNSGTWTSTGSMVSPLTISGLANATTYVVAIRAVTSSGGGAASAGASVTTPDAPAAPVLGSIVGGDTTLSIPFAAGPTGGSAITSYQYQLVTSGAWTTASSSTSPIVVTGLTNGTTYQVSLRAINAVGNGTAAAPEAATPATVPGAPAIVGNTIAGSNLQLSAAFTPPASDGGSAVTDYEYSTDAGATWRSAGTTASPIIITALSVDGTTALVNGVTYFVELRAVNAIGTGTDSAVATGIAQTFPSAPTIASVTPGPSSLAVAFAAASNGGAAITGYQYQLGSSGWVSTGTLGTSFLITGLTNGTSYGVTLRAVNAVDSGTASGSMAGTPLTTPDPPTISAVTRGNRSLTVAVADGSNGGSAITSWQYSTDGGSSWFTATATTSPLVITALSTDGVTSIANGTSYPVAVRAVNAAGASDPSATTGVGPSTTPAAPSVVLLAQNQAVQVTFTISDNGGSPVSALEYQLNGGSWVNAGTLSSPFVIGSLTNGTPYSVNVRADNAIGVGSPSISASATPLTVPDAPMSVSAVSDTASADVSWAPPANTGGSGITNYLASAFLTPGSLSPVATCASSTTSCSITGLTDGVVYYISVIAQNAAGAGAASTPTVAVTPLDRPGAPTLNSLTPGDSFLTLDFTAGSAGSSSITAYQYQLNGGSWLSTSSTTTPLTISGVTNGTSYDVALRAISDAGAGVASATLTATPYGFPAAPDPSTTIANGVGGAVVVSWLAPNDNGSPITSYTATAFDAPTAGTQVTTCTTATLTCTLNGLSNGTTYYVSLQSQNAAGLSARSARIAVAPSLLPSAVSAVTGVAGNGQVALSWTPGSTGATAISDYTVWYASTGAYVLFNDGVSTSTSATVTGLTNGTAYTFEIYAVNTGGTGPVSLPSAAITPVTVSSAPTIGVATAGNATATVSWTPPSDNGGSPVTDYVITPSVGAPVTVGNVLTYTISALTNGTPYTFQVAAINSAGTGAQSAPSNSVTPAPTVPHAPTIGVATAANTSATISWTPPIDDGGSAVTGYVITPSSGAPVTVGNVTTYTVTGLTDGTAYTFTVTPTNIVGAGASSAASNSVTPAPTTPGAPTVVVASAGNTTATLSWTPPVDNGGLVITGYVITPSSGPPITVGNVTTYTLTGLVNGTGYTFTVAAINQVGTGTPFVASSPVTPSAGGGGAAAGPTAPVQIFGVDRFATAVATSVAEFPSAASAGAVVLARSDDYPDALVGIRFAAAKNAPLLFTSGGALTTSTQAEILRVLPAGGTVYLLGGPAAVPTSVAATLTGLGYVVQRLGGTDRFGTALAVAAALGNPGTVLLATGTNFPDALAAGPAATHVGGVVLLTNGSVLPASVRAYLNAHPGVVYAVGGPAAAADPTAIALMGADRYATAVAVAGLFSTPSKLGVASGVTFADALSGGAFLARIDGPLLLSAPTALPSSTSSYLQAVRSSVVSSTLFGGPAALASVVATAVATALGMM
ncbi:MAG TPA: fibronectin type III domain-containing protein [Acidothermaceae bacterium]|jgi:titin